jgi:multiple sugar transport system permease protein
MRVSATTVNAPAARPLGVRRARGSLLPRLLILPAVAVVLATVVYPAGWSLWMSLHAWYPANGTPARWVGLQNYKDVLSSGAFWHAAKNLVFYVVVAVGLEMVLGTLIALALCEFVKRTWLRVVLLTAFILPMMLAPAVVGDIWRFVFERQGVLNYLLSEAGLPEQDWTSASLGLWSVVIADIWQWTALPLLIIFAGRSALPNSLFEAARLDGASWWFRTRTITLPMLRDLVVIALLLRVMDSYKLIDSLYIITSGGGPGTANQLPGLQAYLVAFRDFNIGQAATLTWIIGLLAMVPMRLFWIAFRRKT